LGGVCIVFREGGTEKKTAEHVSAALSAGGEGVPEELGEAIFFRPPLARGGVVLHTGKRGEKGGDPNNFNVRGGGKKGELAHYSAEKKKGV